MSTDYYVILWLSPYEDSQEAIHAAYKRGTDKLRAELLANKDVESDLILLNEAYLVLSDSVLKRQYDYCLLSGVEDDELDRAISEKREQAKQFVRSNLAVTPKKKKRSKWPAWICGFLLVVGILGPWAVVEH